MTGPMFRPTPNGVVAVVELSQSDLDTIIDSLPWNSDLSLRVREAATLVRRMEAHP